MKTRDIIVGFLVLVVLITGVLLFKNSKKNDVLNLPSSTPSIFQRITEKFGGITIPSNADRADLVSVMESGGIGEAIRVFENSKFELTVLADLPEPTTGYFYQAWMGNGTTFISLGKLNLAKGGYLIDFSSAKNYSNYKEIVVTLEKTFDQKQEESVLEGSFN
ncbi:MAG: hypothetical protein HYV90_00670 [Candidatus Woesebacteria bacterium]|nr:MAG: hypothetical protein HYV90_00670 [Candidatus Woesebacteria bacterium]